MSAFLCILLSNILIINHINAAKILAVFPVPSISHQVVFRPLTQELARRGYDVTVITTDPVFPKGRTPPNLTEIDVHEISYDIWKETFMSTSKGNKNDILPQLHMILEIMVSIFEVQLNDKTVQKIINDKNKKFDLLLIEACVRPALAYSHIYKVPVIQISSFGAMNNNYATVGAPGHPFLYPAITRQKLHNLTLWEKINEMYMHYKTERLYEHFLIVENAMIKRNFGPDTPTLTELSNNVHLLFLNVHPVFEGIRPVPPSVVHMGGIHQKPDKDLPKDLKTYLDSSKTGVINISFGTNVDPSLLPTDRIQVFVRVLSKLPYDVLWKWNKDELPGRSKNIRISKWLPQSDLLKHPKIKVFITQGGLQSTDEAITAGVPLIGVPMLVDQWYNVEKYKYHKIGIGLDMETLTEAQLKDAINIVTADNSYRRNIEKLRSVMQDQPYPPLERAVWWIEHVLRHGGARHLRDPAANITWAQYLELELVLTCLIPLVTVTIVFIIFIRLIYILHNTIRNYGATIKIKRS